MCKSKETYQRNTSRVSSSGFFFSFLFFLSSRMKSLFSRSVHQNSIWLLREVEGGGWVGLGCGGERLFFPRLLCSGRSELERETAQ